jgi:hypothetical protein
MADEQHVVSVEVLNRPALETLRAVERGLSPETGWRLDLLYELLSRHLVERCAFSVGQVHTSIGTLRVTSAGTDVLRRASSELKRIDADTLRRLVEEGAALRQEFEVRTAGMRTLTAEDLGRRSR